MIKPTSKSALKQQCLYLCNLNVEKADKMYDFLIKDMKEIPDVEPDSKSFIQTFGEQANGVLVWFRENQDIIKQGADFFRGLFSKKTPPSAPLPPING